MYHVGRGRNDCLGEPCQFLHLVDVEIGDGGDVISAEHLENLERNILLRDNHVGTDQVDLLLQYLHVVVLLVDHTVDVHVDVLSRGVESIQPVLGGAHEAEGALEQENAGVLEVARHTPIR